MICGGGDCLEIGILGAWIGTRTFCDIRFISAVIYI
jgi:hypothetical protein